MTFFDCTADLVGQLNGNGQKGMLQIDAPLSKISGYANGVRLFLRLSVCPVDRWRLSRRAAGLLLGSDGKISIDSCRRLQRAASCWEPRCEVQRRLGITVQTTGAVPAMKPEATAIGRSARWPLENNLNVWSAHTEIWVFYVTADDTPMTSLVISDHVLLRRNQSRTTCFAVIGWAGPGYY